MLFSIFIFFKFLRFWQIKSKKNICLNQRHYLNKFKYENIKNKKSQNNAQIALNLTWEPNKELSSEYEHKATTICELMFIDISRNVRKGLVL